MSYDRIRQLENEVAVLQQANAELQALLDNVQSVNASTSVDSITLSTVKDSVNGLKLGDSSLISGLSSLLYDILSLVRQELYDANDNVAETDTSVSWSVYAMIRSYIDEHEKILTSKVIWEALLQHRDLMQPSTVKDLLEIKAQFDALHNLSKE